MVVGNGFLKEYITLTYSLLFFEMSTAIFYLHCTAMQSWAVFKFSEMCGVLAKYYAT